MDDPASLLLTAENFVEVLGLERSGESIPPANREPLFLLVVEYLRSNGDVTMSSEAGPDRGLNLRILRSGVYFRVGKPTSAEIQAFALLGALVLGAHVDPAGLSAGIVVALQQRLGQVDERTGERSVADAIVELGHGTARDIVVRLHGKPCRYPESGCRYREDGVCRIHQEDAEAIADDLTARNIVRRLTSAAPVEYGITV